MVSFVLHTACQAKNGIGGLFSRKDPRDAGPLLDIERVLNKVSSSVKIPEPVLIICAIT